MVFAIGEFVSLQFATQIEGTYVVLCAESVMPSDESKNGLLVLRLQVNSVQKK